MRRSCQGLLAAVVALFLVIAPTAAVHADPKANAEKLKAISPNAQPLEVAKYKVLRWVEDQQAKQADRKWSLHPVAPAAIYQFGQQYVVETQPGANNQPAAEWLTGWIAGAGTEINCASQGYKSLEELVAANAYPKLPTMPDGWSVREVARFPASPIRLASDGTGKTMYVLGHGGDVWRADLASGQLTPVLKKEDYVQGADAYGMTFDPRHNRLYIVTNRHDSAVKPHLDRVVIYRTTAVTPEGLPAAPKPWLTTEYPWGVNTFNHGVSYIAFGPDGMLYVSSGSRTDHGETGEEPDIARIPGGELPNTACIWRLDPNTEHPQIEVWTRGLRNAFGFCWDDKGRMFATENGPNADAPEEINLVEAGKHYGFPFQFADWTEKAYPDQPDAPAELNGQLVLPIFNDGPDGMDPAKQHTSTLEAHSCPAGIVYLGDAFPEAHRGTFLVARFGNFIGPRDSGFDVLQMKLKEPPAPDGRLHATFTTFMSPVARPLDIQVSGGKVYICEYSRQTSNVGMLEVPGQLLELSPGK